MCKKVRYPLNWRAKFLTCVSTREINQDLSTLWCRQYLWWSICYSWSLIPRRLGIASEDPNLWSAARSLWELRSCPQKGKNHLVKEWKVVESNLARARSWVVAHGFHNRDVWSKWDLNSRKYIAVSPFSACLTFVIIYDNCEYVLYYYLLNSGDVLGTHDLSGHGSGHKIKPMTGYGFFNRFILFW